MQQIFISYAQDQSHGQRLAKQAQQHLHGQGFTVFRDETGVLPGMEWVKEIERQLKASQLVVLVVSNKVKHSEWVFAEFQMAKRMNIPIVPILAENLDDLPLWLIPLQHLNFSQQVDWQKLMHTIRIHIPLPDPPKVQPSPPIPPSPAPKQAEPVWAKVMGEDGYGRYADLDVKGVIQRFRWIKPGKFLMGSPASEKERGSDEIQHEVTLTQGFWLADSTCTQALWKAVMGNNPSHFSSIFRNTANNPVETVSWNDVQGFIRTLNGIASDLKAKLPTEAQWEYACRAGTMPRYSVGDNITAQQVNFNDNVGKTVSVKSLPANPWGLYEMHGNVWEWCQDWYSSYPAEPVTNPEGSQSGVLRVVRGGSWLYYGRGVRSAYRYGNEPDDRGIDLGFRLALGH
ncbi:MAG: SUMF1/EgtB/PvdO family nonheme iron enzyme [Thiothrix sp.]|uniref:SUMF1/EgtB/PvdO family nonheme iron enzyme n=1 Tax=Thiothrix sp. TaxID=1032 RepID=UPI002618F9EA|nr:SUMF1/EgtB/PvdO family nonheme iron enzyme [Thiothrix sp.]MDD5392497.1 SUMF1/EgtB/PvdO family nonheme iron enzyme [Thiothrix sp.]